MAFGDSVTACHQLPGKSRARLARDAVRSLTKNTREVFEQVGGTFPWAESRGACFLCSSLPHCPLCSFPGPGGRALPFSLFPTCTQGKAKYRGCEDVPSTGPWEQAEGLSEPSLLLDRCLEKEGKAIFYCSMSLCIPAARSRGWGTALCPPPTAPVQGQLPRCWGQATPVPARPSCQPTVRFSSEESLLHVYSSTESQWLPVCSSDWDESLSRKTCRQLGFQK